MISSSQTLLSITQNTNKTNVKQVVLSKARDLSKHKGSHGQITFCQLVEEAVRRTGLSELEILQVIRLLVEEGKLVDVEDSALIKFLLLRNISEYERRQGQLQMFWVNVDEVSILTVLEGEASDLKKHEKFRPPDPREEEYYENGGKGSSKKKLRKWRSHHTK